MALDDTLKLLDCITLLLRRIILREDMVNEAITNFFEDLQLFSHLHDLFHIRDYDV